MRRRDVLHSLFAAGGLAAGSLASLERACSAGPTRPFPDPPVLPLPEILTRDAAFSDYRPCFSPDGEWILFERTNQAQFTTFYIMSSRGGAARQFQPGGTMPMFRPDWSWTRSKFEIVFDSGPSLYLADARSRQVSQQPLLAGDPAARKIYSYPSWFPDGQSLSCTNYWVNVQQDGCSNNNATRQSLLRLTLAGGTQQPLTQGIWPLPQPVGNSIWPGMSSVAHVNRTHGSRPLIAFAGERPVQAGYCQNDNQIWILDPQGSIRLIDPDLLAENQQARAPWWSPNGLFVAFESVRLGPTDNDYRIFIQSPFQPQLLFPVTPGPPWIANHAKWSPCGTKLVFAYQNPEIKTNGFGLALLDLMPLVRYLSMLGWGFGLGLGAFWWAR
jgi:Tol biopolymer transport system component